MKTCWEQMDQRGGGGLLTAVATLTQLLVAVHSIAHDVQGQHHSTLLALQRSGHMSCDLLR